MANMMKDLMSKLLGNISNDVGNSVTDDLDEVSSKFDQSLDNALGQFNSQIFDDYGFIKKFQDMDLDNQSDKNTIKSTLNSLKNEYIDMSSFNQAELLLRRDMHNICMQMPEMRDVIYVIRDAIIECNIATGEVSRTLTFTNASDDVEKYIAQVKELEERFDLQQRTKNTIIPKGLVAGELCAHVSPYSKLFAQIEAIADSKYSQYRHQKKNRSTPITESTSLYSDDNMKLFTETVKVELKASHEDKMPEVNKDEIKYILEHINVSNSSLLIAELGVDGARAMLEKEIRSRRSSEQVFTEDYEAYGGNKLAASVFGSIDDDEVDYKAYKDLKGCHIKYLDPMRMIPIRMDSTVIGYYYVTTTMDLAVNPTQPNGIVDLSFQNYTRNKNVVDQLAGMILKSFDRTMLEKNINLKNEIAQVILAHKFAEGKLSFIYIPEDEVVRFVINEDDQGKGHGVLEPCLFPARNYLMLNMFNLLYTLNNTTTRVHYLRSSGLNKDYARQIEKTIRKYEARRITVDDVYSYQGVLNKVGGISEMVLPSGRGDVKAIETDTIEAVNRPFDTEYLEHQRRQAITGTGVPQLLVINAIDEVDFAKTLEMANARYLSTVSAYKIDFNRGMTKLYQRIMKYCTDIDDSIIQTFRFKFNPANQQELNINVDMINNFNTMYELTSSLFYDKSDLENENGDPTAKQMILKRELAKKYLPQLDFDELEEIITKVSIESNRKQLADKVSAIRIDNEEIDDATKE